MQGKIIKGIGGYYYVHDGERRLVECRARGNFRNESVKPLVGDDAVVRLTEEDGNTGYIEALLPRTNELIRPAVANVDQALILVAVRHPAFHPGLLDRFLLWMDYQGVPALVGIGKTDLDEDGTEKKIREIYEGAGYPVCSFSARTGEGIPALKKELEGRTTVLAGASGVGKSSLLNALLSETAMPTGELSEKLSRGRHTTRHSQIFCFAEHSFLCDTPGFSALDLPPVGEEELAGYFPEFAPFAGDCGFRDCRHGREPDCAVRAAVLDGKIARSRYDSYGKLREELAARKKY